MKTINSTVQAMLDAGVIVEREMLLIDLSGAGQGVFGFWSGVGPITYNSQLYNGAASLIEITDAQEGTGLEAAECTIKLRSVPETSLSPDLLGSLESYSYFQAPVRRYVAVFDPDTRALVNVQLFYSGYVDQMQHMENDSEVYVMAYVKSKSIDNSRTGYRKRSPADQARIWGTTAGTRDLGYQYTAVTGVQTIKWGM